MLYLSVYFIYASDGPNLKAIKIGYSDNVNARLTTLQCQENDISKIHNVKPYHLEIRHQFLIQKPKAGKLEAALHKKFKVLKIHGEWFAPDICIMAWIEESERKLQDELWEATT